MSLCRQHQTHNQRRNLQPDKRAHTHRVNFACVHKHGTKTATEKDEIKRFQTDEDAINRDGENRHLGTKENLTGREATLHLRGFIWEAIFLFSHLCHVDQNIKLGKSSHKDPGACRCSVSEMNSHLQGQVNGEDGDRADSCLYPMCAGSSLVTVYDQKSAVEVVNNDKIFNYGTGLGDEFKGRTATKSWSATRLQECLSSPALWTALKGWTPSFLDVLMMAVESAVSLQNLPQVFGSVES